MILIIYVFALAPTAFIGTFMRRPSLASRGGASWRPVRTVGRILRRMS